MNLRPAIGKASMLFLPWSIPVWLLAYVLLRPDRDASGDVGLAAFFMPAIPPIWLYDKTLARLLER